MNPISKRETEILSLIGDRLFTLLRFCDAPYMYEGETKFDVLRDLEFVNEVCPLNFDILLTCDDTNFLHDMGGFYQCFDRATKQLTDSFLPRCAK